MQILIIGHDAKILVNFSYMPILSKTFLLIVLEPVFRVGCGMEANGKQAKAWLTIPPPVFQPPDAFGAVETVALTTARSLY